MRPPPGIFRPLLDLFVQISDHAGNGIGRGFVGAVNDCRIGVENLVSHFFDLLNIAIHVGGHLLGETVVLTRRGCLVGGKSLVRIRFLLLFPVERGKESVSNRRTRNFKQ